MLRSQWGMHVPDRLLAQRLQLARQALALRLVLHDEPAVPGPPAIVGKAERLLSGFGVLARSGDQGGDKGAEQGFAAAAGIVDELEEAEIGGQLLLREAAVRPQPRAQQGPEALERVD